MNKKLKQVKLIKLANRGHINIVQLKKLCNRYNIRKNRADTDLFGEYLTQRHEGALSLLVEGEDIERFIKAVPLLELEKLFIHSCFGFIANWNGEMFKTIDGAFYTLEEVIDFFKDEPLLELSWEEPYTFNTWLFLEGLSKKGNVINQFYNITCDILFKELRAPMFHEKIEQLE